MTVLEAGTLTPILTISGFAEPSGLVVTSDGRRSHVLHAATNSVAAVLDIPNYLPVDSSRWEALQPRP